MNVDGDRLREDIETNAAFGAVDVEQGTGRTVFAGTEPNRRARDRFVERLKQAGLDVRVDSVGNIAGRWSPPGADAEPIATGSHLDSVPRGGIFDGPLGVYGALEAVRTIQNADVELTHPIEVVCFTEEEGQRFAGGTLGSSVAAGNRSAESALQLTDDAGTDLETALSEIGYNGTDRVDADEWDAWIELHIEQGERLETADVPVGVVTTITGITHCEVTIDGEENHAGTTSMDERADALSAAGEFIVDFERVARERSSEERTAVGTVGKINAEPNATNIVPGRVEMNLDIRSIEYGSIDEMVDQAQRSLDRIAAERNVSTAFEREFDVRPVSMDERCREVAHSACEAAGIETLEMHSGAFHDTMHVANATDAGLLFAPSRNGVSHSPREWTDWDDCSVATQALAETLVSLAT
ncbi:M20 family metallo-hydrolase [Halococcus hamelinensis]|uniref:Amidase, hydantoinase/carbamoylase family protein n=1 Tax=Halococcus hamelinensis 100A6 TaxID=1132509 RepID=M0LVR9_9EURY|nr:M20 family metallo-hydrolase [Halococcus hamelinensis]EMA37258.1 amidase, hydantoinase/carbamoylase family protein [Halococcus hamelinensis 100A6]